ncbi:MAG: YitT family protein [Puniceicoccaceae bacterium]
MKRSRAEKPGVRTWSYLQVAFGVFVMAIAFNGFFRPNALAPGGIAGLAIIVEHIGGIAPYWVIWTFNAIVLTISGLILGRSVIQRSLLGAFLLPLFIYLTSAWIPMLTDDLILASVFGGVITGLGIGIVFRGNGASGGFGSLALLLNQTSGVPIGRALLSLDASILLLGCLVFPLEKVMGAMIAAFIISRTSQALLSGLDSSKFVFIISSQAEQIQSAVLTELDLGLTKLQGEGGYTHEPRTILMVVARPGDMFRLKKLVASYDADAFLILSNASEVLGHGFKQHLLR